MRDTIYRESAIDTLDKHLRMTDVPVSYPGIISALTEWLNELPSAQPEIIHCCECKWLQCNMRPDGYLPKGVDEFECRHWCGYCDPMDYCSYAVRRTNGVDC